jgi:hypothetical protein
MGSSSATASSEDSDSALMTAHRDSAVRFQQCLEDVGIESAVSTIGLEGWDGEFLSIDPIAVNKEYWFNIPGGDNVAWESFDADEVEAAINAGEWVFVDGEADHSAELRACADQSGYFIPSPRFDPREEEATKRQMADASNEWADCARENGYPSLADASVTIDNWDTAPAIKLPASVTVPGLEILLAACPYVNPVVFGKTAEELAVMEPPPIDPQIEIDPATDDQLRAALNAALRESRRENTPGN